MASSPLEESPTPHELEYPPVIPGGSLTIAYQLRGKRVLLIGGGNVLITTSFRHLLLPAYLLTYPSLSVTTRLLPHGYLPSCVLMPW